MSVNVPDYEARRDLAKPPADWIRRAIAVIQVLGGAQGLWFTLPIVFSPRFVIGFPFGIIYAVSIFAGIGLWRNSRRGERWSLLVQAAQVPWFTSPHFAYSLSVGIGLWAGVGSAGARGERRTASSFLIEALFGDLPAGRSLQWTLGVNYLALAALVYLLWTRRRRSAPAA